MQTGHYLRARSCSGFWMRACEVDGCRRGLSKSRRDGTWGEHTLEKEVVEMFLLLVSWSVCNQHSAVWSQEMK